MTSTAREIAVGVDGSDAGARALDWACEEADRRNLGLHLLHVWHEPMVAIGPTTALLVGELHALARRQAEDLLSSMTPDDDLPVRGTALEGPAAAALAEAAEGADQLVVGDRGRGAARRALLGSVSSTLTQHPRGVVTVVGHVPARPSGLVVVGVDDTPAGRRALSRAAMEADARDAHLVAVHARQWHEGSEDDVTETLRGVLRSTLPRRDVDLRVVTGNPVSALLEASSDADLLVVGTRGLDRLDRARLGSVAAGCLHHARCPVQVVPAVLQVA